MAIVYLSEADVRRLMDMPDSINVVEQAFRQLACGQALNQPRSRVSAPGTMLHTMSASAEYLGLIGWKAYTTTRSGARFHVAIYDTQTGHLRALIDANWLGALRTGAASGVATKYMSRAKANTVGIIGTGWQASTQLLAVCAVRQISRIDVFSRNRDRRVAFAREMTQQCHLPVVAVDSSQHAVSGKDIVITATSSKSPVFDGCDLAAGTHINAVGANFWSKAEIDVETVRRASVIVCDSLTQCRQEAGDFAAALEAGATRWEMMHELADVVTGTHPGRRSAEDITLFKSVGLAIEDVAMAGELLRRAESSGVGMRLPLEDL